jgi:hypothetical protein
MPPSRVRDPGSPLRLFRHGGGDVPLEHRVAGMP